MCRAASLFVLICVVCLCLIPAHTSLAVEYTPTTTADGFGAAGMCTLRDAVYAAVHNTASGGCAAGSASETDVITLASGAVYTLTRSANDDTGMGGDLDFTGNDSSAAVDVIIRSSGGTPATIEQTVAGDRVIDIHNGSAVRLEHVIVTGGSGVPGAGIRVVSSALTLDRVTVTGNHVQTGGFGGGLLVAESDLVTISHSQFIDNSAEAGIGGGLYTNSTVHIEGTLFQNNLALTGGAIAANAAGVTVTNSTFVGNRAGGGGDMSATNGASLTANNNTLTAAAIYSTPAPFAAIAVTDSTATIQNSIISPSTGVPCLTSGTGTITASYTRVSATGSPCDGTGSALLTPDTLLVLGDAGGPTKTRLLPPGSNALDGGNPATCTATDGRQAVRRLAQSRCDIGAVEMSRVEVSGDGSAPEGDAITTTVQLMPALPAGASLSLTAAFIAGTASADDVTASDAVLVFDSATPQHTYTVAHIDDDIDEDDEAYTVIFTHSSALAIGTPTVTRTILDNDTANIGLSSDSLTLTEGDAPQPVTAVLETRPSASVTLTLSLDATDIAASATSATIQPDDWSTGATFDLAAQMDMLYEGSEAHLITVTAASADPLYDGLTVTLPVTIIDAYVNLVVNGGFEQDSAGLSAAADKRALGWTAKPTSSGKNRRLCKPSGADSPCAWVLKGGTAQQVKQTLTLPAYSVGDQLVLSGQARRAKLVGSAVAKVVVKLNSGGKLAVKMKFKTGTGKLYTAFTRQVTLDVQPESVASVKLVLSSKATSGKVFFDNLTVYVQPLQPRGNVMPPPALPPGMRGTN